MSSLKICEDEKSNSGSAVR